MADHLINEAKTQLRQLRKGNIDVFPEQLILKCKSLEAYYDGDPRNTRILIDSEPVSGVFSIHVNLNTQRLAKAELGVFLDDCNLQAKVRPKKEVR